MSAKGSIPSLTVFLDSSVILSGLSSHTGGSRKLFDAANSKKLKLLTSVSVLEEVAKHLDKIRIEERHLKQLLSGKTIRVVANPKEQIIEKFHRVTPDPDDAHVLAGAVISGARFLLSLDKKHILTPRVKKALSPILVQSPKEFWYWLQVK